MVRVWEVCRAEASGEAANCGVEAGTHDGNRWGQRSGPADVLVKIGETGHGRGGKPGSGRDGIDGYAGGRPGSANAEARERQLERDGIGPGLDDRKQHDLFRHDRHGECDAAGRSQPADAAPWDLDRFVHRFGRDFNDFAFKLTVVDNVRFEGVNDFDGLNDGKQWDFEYAGIG